MQYGIQKSGFVCQLSICCIVNFNIASLYYSELSLRSDNSHHISLSAMFILLLHITKCVVRYVTLDWEIQKNAFTFDL